MKLALMEILQNHRYFGCQEHANRVTQGRFRYSQNHRSKFTCAIMIKINFPNSHKIKVFFGIFWQFSR